MPSDICTEDGPLIMQGLSDARRASEVEPAAVVGSGLRCPAPADVLTARVRAVTEASAARRRGRP
ncbi:hypothetical protein GCM10010344_44010 [Streptomyces bluensis]|nr:hypothetical protein GCM10010344_44010 [Streptomyces bluensis]